MQKALLALLYILAAMGMSQAAPSVAAIVAVTPQEQGGPTMTQAADTARRWLDEAGMDAPVTILPGHRLQIDMTSRSGAEKLRNLFPAEQRRLTLHYVEGDVPEKERAGMGGFLLLKDAYIPNSQLRVSRKSVPFGRVVRARPTLSSLGLPSVLLQLDEAGKLHFARITKENVGRTLAFVWDGKILTAPRVNEPIVNGEMVVAGSFSPKEAADLAAAIQAASDRVHLRLVEIRELKRAP